MRYMPAPRPSIVNMRNFYTRFSVKEQEAIACFDFLNQLPTSPSHSEDEPPQRKCSPRRSPSILSEMKHRTSPAAAAEPRRSRGRTPQYEGNRRDARSPSSSTLFSDTCQNDTFDGFSLSDSCAATYSSSSEH